MKFSLKLRHFLDNGFLWGVNFNCHPPEQALFIIYYIIRLFVDKIIILLNFIVFSSYS